MIRIRRIFLLVFAVLIFQFLFIVFLSYYSSLIWLKSDNQHFLFRRRSFSHNEWHKEDDERYERIEREIRDRKLIFVGGYPRSGTTLMRSILDVHAAIYCGPETRLLPPMLNFLTKIIVNPHEMRELKNSGIQLNMLHNAMAQFIYSIMYNHGEKVARLCAKDPDLLYYMDFLHALFPRAQFVYMVRDGRAAAFSSIVKSKSGMKKMRDYLRTWNTHSVVVGEKCAKLGADYCRLVKYEELVLHPKETMLSVMAFLNESFSDEQLHHEKFVGKRIKLSPTELSSDQVAKPIYLESLVAWIREIQADYNGKMVEKIAPQLIKFNYSIDINDLDYFKEYNKLYKIP